jgi:peptidoglycan/LPS O-acetylase OafA/YrhL
VRLDDAQRSGRAANNFDALRLVAAACVLFSHSFALTGTDEPEFTRSRLDGGSFGVLLFFSISGFLVARSWRYDPRLGAFTAKRALRLLPGLAAAVLVTALVLGPLVTTEPLGRYLQSPATEDFILDNVALQTNYALPGVFADVPNPYKGIVNGSLWTLPLEVKAYVLVALLGLLGVLTGGGRRWLAIVPAVLFGLLLIKATRDAIPTGNQLVAFLPDVQAGAPVRHQAFLGAYDPLTRYVAAFAVGAALFALAPLVPLRWSVAGVLVAVWAVAVAIGGTVAFVVPALILPYLVLMVAYRTGHWLPKGAGDYSYGVYIYAFPVQQTLAVILALKSGWSMLVLAAPITLAFAALSWRFVEAPALRLKPRRGTAGA